MFFFSDSTSLYLFSALLQANAAIFAILGVFIIFRMQSHKSSIDIIKSALYSDRGAYSTPTVVANFESLNYEQKKKEFSEMKSGAFYYKLYETWIYHLDKNNELKKYITFPSITLTIGMIIDTITLLFATNLHKYHPSSEVFIALLIVAYHIIVWIVIAKDLIKVIKSG